MLTRLLRQHLRPYAAQVAVVVTVLAIQTVGNLFLPNLNADIINNGVVKGDVRYIFQTGALMLAVTLVLGLMAGSAGISSSGLPQAGFGADGAITVFAVGFRSRWMTRAMASTVVIP
jgi:hypothetical protein